MGSIRRILGDRRAADTSQGTGSESPLQETAGGREATDSGEEGVRGHRICAAYWHSLEGIAERGVWQRECDPPVFL